MERVEVVSRLGSSREGEEEGVWWYMEETVMEAIIAEGAARR
jgi:hypothetical protein